MTRERGKQAESSVGASQKANIVASWVNITLQTEREIAVCTVGVAPVSRSQPTGLWLERRHAFIYSSTFWELAMRDKVNTLFPACTRKCAYWGVGGGGGHP